MIFDFVLIDRYRQYGIPDLLTDTVIPDPEKNYLLALRELGIVSRAQVEDSKRLEELLTTVRQSNKHARIFEYSSNVMNDPKVSRKLKVAAAMLILQFNLSIDSAVIDDCLTLSYPEHVAFCLGLIRKYPGATQRATELEVLEHASKNELLACIDHIHENETISVDDKGRYYQQLKNTVQSDPFKALLYAQWCFKHETKHQEGIHYFKHACKMWGNRGTGDAKVRCDELLKQVVESIRGLVSPIEFFDLIYSPEYQVFREQIPVRFKLHWSVFQEDCKKAFRDNQRVPESVQRQRQSLLRESASDNIESALLLSEQLLKQDQWIEGIYFLKHACTLLNRLNIDDQRITSVPALESLLVEIIDSQILTLLPRGVEMQTPDLNNLNTVIRLTFAMVYLDNFGLSEELRARFLGSAPQFVDALKNFKSRFDALMSAGQFKFHRGADLLMKSYLAAKGEFPIADLRTLINNVQIWGIQAKPRCFDAVKAIVDQKRLMTWKECRKRRLKPVRKDNATNDLVGLCICFGSLLFFFQLVLALCSRRYIAQSTMHLMVVLIPTWIFVACFILPLIIKLMMPLFKLGSDYLSTKYEAHPNELITDEEIQTKLLAEYDNHRSVLATERANIESYSSARDLPGYDDPEVPQYEEAAGVNGGLKL